MRRKFALPLLILAAMCFATPANAQCTKLSIVGVLARQPIIGHHLRAHHEAQAARHQAIAGNIAIRQDRRAVRRGVIVIQAEVIPAPKSGAVPSKK